MQTLERADIESVVFGGHDSGVTQVPGYQSYDIYATQVTTVSEPGPLRLCQFT